MQEKKDAVHPPPRPASPPLLCLPGPKGDPETGRLSPSIHKLSSLPSQEQGNLSYFSKPLFGAQGMEREAAPDLPRESILLSPEEAEAVHNLTAACGG